MSFSSTPVFDASKGYQKKGDGTYFNDGREVELLHFVYNRPNIDEIRNSPAKVVATIDQYARTKKYLMNVGEDKGKIVTDLIAEVKPKTLVELGGYVGYSSILFGAAFRSAGGQRYYTLEHNPEFGAVIGSLVELAGLSDIVKVVVGDSGASLERMHREEKLKKIDFLFIDHTQFERDIKLAEKLGLVTEGCVVAADNCIYPGHPEYWEYMSSSVAEKRKASETATSEAEVGNSNLIYDSKLVHSFEPSGEKDAVGISMCTGTEA
ncbi:putative catechol O-methyltransferase 2 [Fulvia fulva]|uniref:catechol O-methyltransferase n=1 Tax=Passalora fulva TaxID=5499 RepID=A0A9Q8PKD0_PASFU|nr:putative catechol O-methyltransferase 2 [Fulvia fulva]KAK4611748.1 putative catechol O-methyltransferase 2 [Fulvia fulva]KAK4612758.1 putative catechol O-methyltransferase 2 [Fulvia fulva]UJO24058.1 putative catechol O-methyltransferase 2 [Fulvia fulva]WPV21512.1 putative catechol O-methyltransferase 2 [Fulvia fulva]WPV36283.1 putative catechol O-methyltransferase 2 [Fulvia fulva]